MIVLSKPWENTQIVFICFAYGETETQRRKGPILETGMQSSMENPVYNLRFSPFN